jgi:prephenate dehydrogenase
MDVAVVGLGLMGGSLGLALRERAGMRVAGYDPDPAARAVALERGCVERAAEDLQSACEGAGLVVVCAPVAALPAAIAAVLEAAPGDATVTDVGSTKANVVAAVPAHQRHRFVGGHPVCGSEARGAQAARAELFDGATYFLTPVHDTDPARFTELHGVVGRIGARPVAIDPVAHDRLVAMTSHLPHVIANLLATQAGATTIDGHDPLAAAGGSFRDMTRVAGANPRIWVDIFLDNREALLDAAREHQRRLADVVSALERADAGYLARWIGEASSARRRVLDAAFSGVSGDLHTVRIHVPDRPGAISGIAQAFGAARINIEDFVLHHMSPEQGGVAEITVAGADAAERAVRILDEQGYGAIATRLDPEAAS